MTLKIGIPAQNHDDKFGVNTNYLRWIYNFGSPIVIMPETLENFKEIYKLDALVIPGGQDVDPKRYTNKPALGVGNSNTYLEHFDTAILPELVNKIPIFGICRGLQTLNVYFGGTLRNLWWHPYSNYDEHEVHPVWDFNEKNPKKENSLFKVNSFHHQGIEIIARNLKPELVDINDDVIEAVSDLKHNIFAVQWHPERLGDNYSKNMFTTILRG